MEIVLLLCIDAGVVALEMIEFTLEMIEFTSEISFDDEIVSDICTCVELVI